MDDKDTDAHFERMQVADEVTRTSKVIAQYLDGFRYDIEKLARVSRRLGELDGHLGGAR